MADGGLSSAEVFDKAVFSLEVASRSMANPGAGLAVIRGYLHGASADDLRRVVACLATHAVTAIPPEKLARWVETLALEHQMMLDAPEGAGSGG